MDWKTGLENETRKQPHKKKSINANFNFTYGGILCQLWQEREDNNGGVDGGCAEKGTGEVLLLALSLTAGVDIPGIE